MSQLAIVDILLEYRTPLAIARSPAQAIRGAFQRYPSILPILPVRRGRVNGVLLSVHGGP